MARQKLTFTRHTYTSELLAELATWNPTPLLKTLHEHIFSRLQIMQKVGLGYLSLDQEVSSLSTGELHRLQIATHITAKLSGMTYVFDEPMTGLHPQDRKHLITLFKELKDLSNTVIVVEHDLETIQSADWVIELGPKAGKEGGQLIYEGKPKQLPKTPSIYSYSKKFTTYLTIGPFSQNNLKDVQIQVPLNAFVGFCGVSGAGKSTLLLDAFAPHFREMLKEGVQSGLGDISVVDTRYLSAIPRSTVSSYLKLTSPLRKLLSETKLGKATNAFNGTCIWTSLRLFCEKGPIVR